MVLCIEETEMKQEQKSEGPVMDDQGRGLGRGYSANGLVKREDVRSAWIQEM